MEFLPGSGPPFLQVHFGHIVGQVYREMALLGGESLARAGDSRSIVEQEIMLGSATAASTWGNQALRALKRSNLPR